MKYLPCLALALLLGGCAHGTAPQEAVTQAPDTPPAGMFKLLEDAELVTWFDARSVTLYQGNPQLRQFYLINNYLAAVDPGDKSPEIRSSRATRVINCERDEMAQFGRVYFSQPFAQGQEVVRKNDIAQWEPLQRQSLIGMLRDVACKVDAARLRPGSPG
ncbi:surface-adhesin E family protein [Pseudomonas sp. 148P]|uniref:Surface-adhesin E family protein n=1 Tax=Pseudomonas ulcerans TaxID=3115852 RepID=A0ABU7HX51_9PSED|nr:MULTISPECIES: surface-adhesin E family protein [unclassified Pseudomonas]MEE1924735.1 surface-adhesin E family protein [Pseudomonas sp. 147P]MEE1936144.1 surface-adhesin E family protein [Pseudomonas sp. 148P]